MAPVQTDIKSTSQLGRCAVTRTPCNAHLFSAYEVDHENPETPVKLIRQVPLAQIPVRPFISRNPAYQDILEWLRHESDRLWNTYREKVKLVKEKLLEGADIQTGTFKVSFEQTFIDTTQKASACIEDVLDENAARAEFNSVFSRLYPGSTFKVLNVERLGDYPMPLPQE